MIQPKKFTKTVTVYLRGTKEELRFDIEHGPYFEGEWLILHQDEQLGAYTAFPSSAVLSIVVGPFQPAQTENYKVN